VYPYRPREGCIKELYRLRKHFDFSIRWNSKVDKLDLYDVINLAFWKASREKVIFINDDMYFPSGWIEGFREEIKNRRVVTHLAFGSELLERNQENPWALPFGKTPTEFREEKFLDFLKKFNSSNITQDLIFPMPIGMTKTSFLESGGYPVFKPFPFPNDLLFIKKLRLLNFEFKLLKNSASYHFIRGSQR